MNALIALGILFIALYLLHKGWAWTSIIIGLVVLVFSQPSFASEREDNVLNYMAVYTDLVDSARRCHVELIVNEKKGIACGVYLLISDDYSMVSDKLYLNGVFKDKRTYNLISENETYYRFFEKHEASKLKLKTHVDAIDKSVDK